MSCAKHSKVHWLPHSWLIVAVIRRLGLFLLIFEELFVINDANNWWFGVCGDFDEVYVKVLCEVESVTDGKDVELLVVVVNNLDFVGCDFVVHANGFYVKI